MSLILAGLGGLIPGVIIGWFVVKNRAASAAEKAEKEHQNKLAELETEQAERLDALRDEIKSAQHAEEDALKAQIAEVKERAQALGEEEKSLKKARQKLNSEMSRVQSQTDSMTAKEEQLQRSIQSMEARETELETALERVAGLTRDEALNQLEEELRGRAHERAAAGLRQIQQQAQEEIREASAALLAKAVFRYGGEVIQEITTTAVHLPSDDLKGRIIGREGRNIQSFEEATGVDVIIDDTPGIITLSSFSPLRRLVAHETMLRLLRDGRIHPTRIEESVAKVRKAVDRSLRQKGEEAAAEIGVQGLDGAILDLLGKLSIHQVNGQNQLHKALSSARLAERLAAELGLNPKPCRRAALLSLIGCAADHQMEGSTGEVTVALARRYGEAKAVIAALEDLCRDSGPKTTAGIVVQLAAKLASSRPGVQSQQLAESIERLEALEQMALEEEGVRQAHVLQAGTEIRVLVDPAEVSEGKLMALAQRLVRRIEDRADRLGEVQVHVVRETRVTETAM